MHEHQAAFYAALQAGTAQADSASFVAFMLDRILEAITSVDPQVERLLLGLR